MAVVGAALAFGCRANPGPKSETAALPSTSSSSTQSVPILRNPRPAIEVTGVGAGGSPAAVAPPTVKEVANLPPLTGSSATLSIHGLACPSCAKGVLRELKQLPGVTSVELDTVQGLASIDFDPARPPPRQDIKNAVHWGGGVLIEIRQP